MLADHGPEGDQRLAEATVDWNDRLTRGQESLAQATTHLDAAETALATASGHRLAAETPGLLPTTGSLPEHDLATMTNDIEAAQERTGVLRERLESDLETLKYDVLGQAGNPPSGWRSGIRDAAASIRWTGSVHAGIATQLGSVSSQLDGLASKLERYSPESASSESAHSAGPSSEQDLRRRTAVKPAGRGAQAGK
ncbi:MAG TPA: hypothetical protein VGL05_34340 [Kribbella sp.]